MHLRQLRQAGVIFLNVFQRHGSRIARNVVCSRQDHNDLRLQINHVLPEADQHLWSRLSSDTAV